MLARAGHPQSGPGQKGTGTCTPAEQQPKNGGWLEVGMTHASHAYPQRHTVDNVLHTQ